MKIIITEEEKNEIKQLYEQKTSVVQAAKLDDLSVSLLPKQFIKEVNDEILKHSELISKINNTYKTQVTQNPLEFLKSKGVEDRLNTPQVFKDFPDIDKESYQEACQFVSYYGGSFDFFDKNIEDGGKMPLTSAIEIGGKWYIIGGNRRMTYYVLSGINPTIWLIKL